MGIFDFLKKPSAKKPSFAKATEDKEPKPKFKKSADLPAEVSTKAGAPQKRSVGGKKDLREVYKILKEPHISEKSTQLSDQGKYAFRVYSRANKPEIKKAVSNLYGVEVRDVKIVNIKPKKRMLRGIEGAKAGYKKAIVTLEKGHKIEIMPH